MDERIKKQLEFALEIDKEKSIYRQNIVEMPGESRRERWEETAG